MVGNFANKLIFSIKIFVILILLCIFLNKYRYAELVNHE